MRSWAWATQLAVPITAEDYYLQLWRESDLLAQIDPSAPDPVIEVGEELDFVFHTSVDDQMFGVEEYERVFEFRFIVGLATETSTCATSQDSSGNSARRVHDTQWDDGLKPSRMINQRWAITCTWKRRAR